MAAFTDLPVVCPAAEAIGAVRGVGLPGVRCRIEHSTLDAKGSGRSIAGYCCAAPAEPRPARKGSGIRSTSYVDCPTWEYEKLLLEAGHHSLGDPDELERANERARRYDLTGDEYGDTSMMDEVEHAVQENKGQLLQQMNEGGEASFSVEA